jgi:hypothetical protein
LPLVEVSRESGQGAGVRTRIYDAVAAASEAERGPDPPASAAPALTEQLRGRMEDVRGRLRALADAAVAPEASDPRPAWPPPDPRDAVPAPPPDAATVTVQEDLLHRIRDDLVATRALIVRTSTALARSVSGVGGEIPEQRQVRAADLAEPPPLSSDREKACMVALNMALNGASRAETDRYLAEHFDLVDANGIVADAYAHWARMRASVRNGDAAQLS